MKQSVNLPFPVKTPPRELIKDILFFVAGTFLYSTGVSIFTAPNHIAPGGITGISTILHYLVHTPIGTMFFVLNIPLILIALRFLGKRLVVKTILCTVFVSIFTDVLALPFVPTYTDNSILAALYGGLLSGAGLGLVFLRGGTTGGSDILGRLLRLKWPHISMGRMILLVDFCVIALSALVFWNVNVALFAIVVEFTSSRVIDSLLYGAENGRMALIFSDLHDDIAEAIRLELNRGITVMKGEGYYTGKENEVLICAVRRTQVSRLRALVNRIDPQAFVIMCRTDEVLGRGFKPLKQANS